MEVELTSKDLTVNEKLAIESLMEKKGSADRDDLKHMWYLMDLVWDDYGCNSKKLNWDKVGQFYSHPVWLLNGLFIEQDDVSMGHRHAISDWVVQNDFTSVVDYGGGFGTLAKLIAGKDDQIKIDIYEPYPSDFGLKRINGYTNIDFTDVLKNEYQCLLSTDVLEHVEDPLSVFSTMINSVRTGGYLVIANCFYPVIKCHLPRNFHFRFTFDLFAKLMGLERLGQLNGSHATIYKKGAQKVINWGLVRKAEVLSKFTFPLIQFAVSILRPIKRLFFK